jgi:hypothetical protein
MKPRKTGTGPRSRPSQAVLLRVSPSKSCSTTSTKRWKRAFQSDPFIAKAGPIIGPESRTTVKLLEVGRPGNVFAGPRGQGSGFVTPVSGPASQGSRPANLVVVPVGPLIGMAGPRTCPAGPLAGPGMSLTGPAGPLTRFAGPLT